MIEREHFIPNEDETLEQYKYRLYAHKEIDKTMTWADVQFLLGYYFDSHKTIDFLRHEYYGSRKLKEIEEINVGTRILCVSDTHVPFNLPVETFAEYRGKVDVLVFNGDILDNQSLSKFSKLYRVPIMEEMVRGREFMINLIEYIRPKKVKVNYGNHEARLNKYLADRLNEDVLELMPTTVLDYIMTTGFTHYNHRERTRVFYEPLCGLFDDIEVEYTKSWWCKVGQTIFCHPSAFSSGILKTTEKAMQYFLQERESFDSVVMAHTHQMGWTYFGKIHLFEQGCCCDSSEMSYTDGKLYKSQTNGFAYIVQDKIGNLIYDKSKLVLL